MNAPLPQVVEFDHCYDVRLEHTGHTTRVVARVKPKAYTATYKKLHDLPFCAPEPASGHWNFWAVPRAATYDEAALRGKYFWEEFIRFARGGQRKRREDAIRALHGHILPAMRAKGGTEATVFLEQLAETVIDALRVGVDA